LSGAVSFPISPARSSLAPTSEMRARATFGIWSKDGPKRGLYWDVDAADRIYRYFRSVLRLAGGSHEGKPFELEPSQKFINGSIFGWKRADGSRRFRMAFIEE
jgi:hypothetical protein